MFGIFCQIFEFLLFIHLNALKKLPIDPDFSFYKSFTCIMISHLFKSLFYPDVAAYIHRNHFDKRFTTGRKKTKMTTIFGNTARQSLCKSEFPLKKCPIISTKINNFQKKYYLVSA